MDKNPLSPGGMDHRGRLRYRRLLPVDGLAHRRGAVPFSLLTLVFGLTYLIWISRLICSQREVQDYLFLAAEILSFLLLALLSLHVWHPRPPPVGTVAVGAGPTVDIFIPCCGEPLEIIKTTLTAVARIRYHPVAVYVLDDGNVSAVASLAQALGFHYLSRPRAGFPLADAKSGNLNFGLSRSGGELILVLDADQVPDPEILSHLVECFHLPEVAYVQSKQAFFLPEGDPFYNGDQIFYETIQWGNDRANAVISCGSGVIYRRRALEALGGFPTWNIVEDFTASYEMVSRGWRGVYYPYPLSRGLAPVTLAGVYRQRFQWCLDTMRLFLWDNPLWKSGLNWRQRCHFLVVMMSYLASGLVFPIFYAIPLFVYWGGYSSLMGHELPYWVLRTLYLLATVLMFRSLFFRQDAWKQFKMLCSLFPVHALAILAALMYPPGRKPAYQVNNLQPFTAPGHWWHVAPHVGFISLHLTLPFISFWQGWALPRLILFNAVFSACIIWVLGDLVLAALAKPRWSPAMDPRHVYGH